ncbi:MAG: hypothetical protein NW223_11120 [Hyphomicrobiaceae bacterium]|nr:hypothetical protein [Hyphomicrobiaceae bacterium]
MTTRFFAALVGALTLLSAWTTGAWAQYGQRSDWVLLGEQTVGFRVDRDVINVNQSEDWYRSRAFRTLHFKAERNEVHMMSIRLVYLNGYAEDFRVDRLIREGGDLALDLRGDRSFIRSIEMVYKTRPNFEGRAVVKVFGELARMHRPEPPRQDWVLLGEQTVGFRVDRDVINVNQSEDWYRSRAFRTLHFKAERNDVHMMSVRLVYLNGYAEDFRVDRLIREGGDMALDLRGDRSFIRAIEMVYKARPNYEGRAVVKVFAELGRGFNRPEPGHGGRGDWTELGCQQVSLFGKDRDSIRVGRREGRFKAIRLHVRGADVEMLDLKVVYANGQPDDVPVRAVIREGSRTRPLDLQGWERAIDRVEMVYRTIPNFKGMATVCVEGLH